MFFRKDNAQKNESDSAVRVPHNSRRAVISNKSFAKNSKNALPSDLAEPATLVNAANAESPSLTGERRSDTQNESSPRPTTRKSPAFISVWLFPVAALLLAAIMRGYWLQRSLVPDYTPPVTRTGTDAGDEVWGKIRLMEEQLSQRSEEVEQLKLLAVSLQSQLRQAASHEAVEEWMSSVESADNRRFASLEHDLASVRERIGSLDNISSRIDDTREQVSQLEQRSATPSDSLDAAVIAKLEMVDRALFGLDRAGIDWAKAQLGTTIIHSQTSRPLGTDNLFENFSRKLAQLPPWSENYVHVTRPRGRDAEVVQMPDFPMLPGECFAFDGGRGTIALHLPMPLDVTAVGVSHLPVNTQSAARRITVTGISDPAPQGSPADTGSAGETAFIPMIKEVLEVSKERLTKKLAAIFSYEDVYSADETKIEPQSTVLLKDQEIDFTKKIGDADMRQIFTVSSDKPILRIVFDFEDNHGAPYTCIYRLHVYAKLPARNSPEYKNPLNKQS